MSVVVFITEGIGQPKILHDAEGKIGSFVNSKNDIIETDEGLQKNPKIKNIWFLAFDAEKDADKIARVKKLKTFGVGITETDIIPVINTTNNLKSFGFNADAIKIAATQEAADKFEKDKQQLKKDSARYGQLFSQICKNGGGYIVNADSTLVAEFEQLKSKLGIEENNE